jgi:hypothetical protein
MTRRSATKDDQVRQLQPGSGWAAEATARRRPATVAERGSRPGQTGRVRHTPPTDASASIWQPDRPERRVTGRFTWDGERGSAQVIGHLVELGGVSFAPADWVRTYDLLHANLDGTNFTLVGCRERIGSIYRDEVVSSAHISCRLLIEGIHLAAIDDEFAAVVFRLDSADDWIGRAGLSRKVLWKPTLRSEVVYEAGPNDEAGTWTIADGVTTSLDEAPQSIRTTRIHTLTHRPPRGVDVRAALETVKAVQRLAALCTGRVPEATSVVLEHPVLTAGTNLSGEPAPRRYPLYFDQRSADGPRADGVPPVTLAGLGGAAVLDRWLERHDEIRSVVTMIIAVRAGEIPYLEQMFINNALCAELLDRHDRSGAEGGDVRTDADQFARLTEAALGAVDGGDREELARILRYANTPPLHQRLKRLAVTADPIRKTLFAEVKHGRWAQVVAGTRNALTHADGLARDERSRALHWLNASVQWVVIVNVLAPLHEAIAEALLTSSSAQTAAGHLGAAVETLGAYLDAREPSA